MCVLNCFCYFTDGFYHLLQEVKIPGKKMFGFTSETRLFVSSVEEGSTAADLLAPGDEIVQVHVYGLAAWIPHVHCTCILLVNCICLCISHGALFSRYIFFPVKLVMALETRLPLSIFSLVAIVY